jgi:hypothetical protein
MSGAAVARKYSTPDEQSGKPYRINFDAISGDH